MSDGYIQSAASNPSFTASPVLITLSGVTTGSRIVAFAMYGAGGSPTSPSLSDGQGSYSAVGSAVGPNGDSVWVQVYELKNANSGTHNLSFSYTGTAGGFLLAVECAADTGTTSTTSAGSQSNPGTGTNALSSGSVTVSSASTMVSLLNDTSSTNTSDEPTAGTSPFTFASRAANANAVIGAWRIQTAAAGASGAATGTAVTGTHNFITIGVAAPNASVATGGGPLTAGLVEGILTSGRLIA